MDKQSFRAFISSIETQNAAIERAAGARRENKFHAFGRYWDGRKGNVSGAMYNGYLMGNQIEQDVMLFPEPVHGIPVRVAGMVDDIFCGLSLLSDKSIHMHWAEEFYETIVPGTDLAPIPDSMITLMLEQAEWLADYAEDEKLAHLVGLMHSIFIMRLNGINQDKRLKEFYYDNIHGLHRHQLNGARTQSGHVYAALRALCGVDPNTSGAIHHFLDHCVRASAKGLRVPMCIRWEDISKIFLQMVREA